MVAAVKQHGLLNILLLVVQCIQLLLLLLLQIFHSLLVMDLPPQHQRTTRTHTLTIAPNRSIMFGLILNVCCCCCFIYLNLICFSFSLTPANGMTVTFPLSSLLLLLMFSLPVVQHENCLIN